MIDRRTFMATSAIHGSPNVAVSREGLDMEERG
jgi:hypothetical protein